jgi:hypothetical protein
VSADERLHLLVALYFSEERLGFDPETDVRIRDDGAAEVIDHEINRMCFLRGMLCNGRTEIYNGDTGERLARTDPCVPMNIDIARSLDAIEEITTELRAEREKRTRRLPPE